MKTAILSLFGVSGSLFTVITLSMLFSALNSSFRMEPAHYGMMAFIWHMWIVSCLCLFLAGRASK